MELFADAVARVDKIVDEKLVDTTENSTYQMFLSMKGSVGCSRVGLIGNARVGKTTLLNRIIGYPLLPLRFGDPATAVITEVVYSEVQTYRAMLHVISSDEWITLFRRGQEELKVELESESKTPFVLPNSKFLKEALSALGILPVVSQKAVELIQRTQDPLVLLPKEVQEAMNALVIPLSHNTPNDLAKDLFPRLCRNAKRADHPCLMWPIIWKATIFGPFTNLKNFTVIDLPGFGDGDEVLTSRAYAGLDVCDELYLVLRAQDAGNKEAILEHFIRHPYFRTRVRESRFGIVVTQIPTDWVEENVEGELTLPNLRKTYEQKFSFESDVPQQVKDMTYFCANGERDEYLVHPAFFLSFEQSLRLHLGESSKRSRAGFVQYVNWMLLKWSKDLCETNKAHLPRLHQVINNVLESYKNNWVSKNAIIPRWQPRPCSLDFPFTDNRYYVRMENKLTGDCHYRESRTARSLADLVSAHYVDETIYQISDHWANSVAEFQATLVNMLPAQKLELFSEDIKNLPPPHGMESLAIRVKDKLFDLLSINFFPSRTKALVVSGIGKGAAMAKNLRSLFEGSVHTTICQRMEQIVQSCATEAWVALAQWFIKCLEPVGLPKRNLTEEQKRLFLPLKPLEPMKKVMEDMQNLSLEAKHGSETRTLEEYIAKNALSPVRLIQKPSSLQLFELYRVRGANDDLFKLVHAGVNIQAVPERSWYASSQFGELLLGIFQQYRVYEAGGSCEFYGSLHQIDEVARLLRLVLVPQIVFGEIVLSYLKPYCELKCDIPTLDNLVAALQMLPSPTGESPWLKLPANELMTTMVSHVAHILTTFEKRHRSSLEKSNVNDLEAFYHVIFHACLKSQLGDCLIGSEVTANFFNFRRIDTVVLSGNKQDLFVLEFKRAGSTSCEDAIAQCLITKNGESYFDIGLTGKWRRSGKIYELGPRTADHVFLVGIVCDLTKIEAKMSRLSDIANGNVEHIKQLTAFNDLASQGQALQNARALLNAANTVSLAANTTVSL